MHGFLFDLSFGQSVLVILATPIIAGVLFLAFCQRLDSFPYEDQM